MVEYKTFNFGVESSNLSILTKCRDGRAWLIAPDLKSGVRLSRTEGSNPSRGAIYGEISSMVEREFVALDISVQFWYLTPFLIGA